MNYKPIVLFIIAITVCSIIYCVYSPGPNNFGQEPTQMDEISSNIEFIGKFFRHGEIACVTNVGVDLMYNGTKTWISMKEFCEMVIKQKEMRA